METQEFNNLPSGVETQPNPSGEPVGQPTAPPAKKKSPKIIVVIAVVTLVAVAAVILFFTLRPKTEPTTLRTYFDYTEAEVESLKDKKSSREITTEQLHKWEDKAYELVEDHKIVDVDASKVYTYLMVAQMDAAALSHQAHGSFMGTVDTVSKDVLCEFFPDSCSALVSSDDEYSKQLASLVMANVKQRIAEDTAQTKPYTLKTGQNLWQGPEPQIGLSAGSFKQWLTPSSDTFRSTPPPAAGSAEQQSQLAEVKQTLANATNEQKAIVVEWAGGPGTKTPPGIWLALATHYMEEQEDISLDTYLETRAFVAMAMADAVSAVFDSKYTYQYKRPNMFDTSIVTVMPTPNHPSYPAGHATISWAAATVLSHFLPENQAEWESLAKEASDSRTIGGIHFPMDNEAGTKLGKDVGTAALEDR